MSSGRERATRGTGRKSDTSRAGPDRAGDRSGSSLSFSSSGLERAAANLCQSSGWGSDSGRGQRQRQQGQRQRQRRPAKEQEQKRANCKNESFNNLTLCHRRGRRVLTHGRLDGCRNICLGDIRPFAIFRGSTSLDLYHHIISSLNECLFIF